LRALFLALIVGQFVWLSCQARAEPTSLGFEGIEYLQERARIGAAHLSTNESDLYFELIRPYSEFDGTLPYRTDFSLRDARKHIMSVPVAGSGPPIPLFPQETSEGYWFANESPYSPGDDKLLIIRLKDGELNPGVFSVKDRAVRFYDIALDDGVYVPVAYWISHSKVVLLAQTDPKSTISSVVFGARSQSRAREMAWGNRSASVSAIGAGQFGEDNEPLVTNRILILDVESGVVDDVDKGLFWRLEPSPCGRFVSVLRFERSSDQAEAQRPVFGRRRQILSVVDTDTGQISDVVASLNTLAHLAWSANGKRFLFSETRRAKNGVSATQFGLVSAGDSSVSFTFDEDVKTAFWVGDSVFFQRSSLDSETDCNQAVCILNSLNQEIKTELSEIRDQRHLVGVSESEAFFLDSGELLAISSTGQIRQIDMRGLLFEEASIAHLARPRVKMRLVDGYTVTQVGSPPSIYDVAFSSRDLSDAARYGFDAESWSLATLLPERHRSVQLLRGFGSGTYLTQSDSFAHGSELRLFRQYTEVYDTHLLSFNQHLRKKKVVSDPIMLLHDDQNDQVQKSWLYLPPKSQTCQHEALPLIVITYAGLVFGDVPPHSRGVSSAADIWQVAPNSVAKSEPFLRNCFAVLFPSIPLMPFGHPDNPMIQIATPVLNAVDAALETGSIDGDRVAAVGHSYGGYSVLSLAVTTDRFNALVAASPISNLFDHYGQFRDYMRFDAGSRQFGELSSANMFEIGQNRMGNPPWLDTTRYSRNSPVLFVERVKTPVMMIHGDLDFISIDQSEQFFTALARLNRDVLFVRYWGEEHLINQPQNQRDMWKRVFAFLEQNGVTLASQTIH